MSLHNIPVILIPEKTGGYSVFVPLFPGCCTFGDTAEEALSSAKEALELLLDPASEDDLESLELLEVSHVVVGRIDVQVQSRKSVKIQD